MMRLFYRLLISILMAEREATINPDIRQRLMIKIMEYERRHLMTRATD